MLHGSLQLRTLQFFAEKRVLLLTYFVYLLLPSAGVTDVKD